MIDVIESYIRVSHMRKKFSNICSRSERNRKHLVLYRRRRNDSTKSTSNDMIEVVAEILRGPVFLAGEKLHCQITFTNKSSQDGQKQ